MDILDLLNIINRNIFNYEIDEYNKNIILLYDYLQENLSNFNEEKRQILICILTKLEDAYKNSDYILYSDILEFELKQIL